MGKIKLLVAAEDGKIAHSEASEANVNRSEFWAYCIRSEGAAKARALKAGVPCSITRHDIDKMLVDQGWRCAVSGIPLEPPKSAVKYRRNPFSPSVDRIKPAKGYVLGNVRIVCTLVNVAMNEWGLDALLRVVRAIKTRNREAA